MAITLNGQRKPKIEPRTHEETGVTVYFRRLGHVERTAVVGNSDGIGSLTTQLMAPGVGVQKWEGVVDSSGNPVPYSPGAVDSVVEVAPSFGSWFNDNLLDVTGVIRLDARDVEGKSERPDDGSTAGQEATTQPAK